MAVGFIKFLEYLNGYVLEYYCFPGMWLYSLPGKGYVYTLYLICSLFYGTSFILGANQDGY